MFNKVLATPLDLVTPLKLRLTFFSHFLMEKALQSSLSCYRYIFFIYFETRVVNELKFVTFKLVKIIFHLPKGNIFSKMESTVFWFASQKKRLNKKSEIFQLSFHSFHSIDNDQMTLLDLVRGANSSNHIIAQAKLFCFYLDQCQNYLDLVVVTNNNYRKVQFNPFLSCRNWIPTRRFSWKYFNISGRVVFQNASVWLVEGFNEFN